MTPRLPIPSAEIAAVCRRWGVRRLSLFGSVLREDFGPHSDVDVLVEFEPGVRVGLRFFDLQEELMNLRGREVDLVTPGFLAPEFRDTITGSALVQFAA